jgi:hypothetical protein
VSADGAGVNCCGAPAAADDADATVPSPPPSSAAADATPVATASDLAKASGVESGSSE